MVVVCSEVGFCANGLRSGRSMVLRRVWGTCWVEGARSRLQCSAIARSWGLGLNCAWSHGCCRVIAWLQLCGEGGTGRCLFEERVEENSGKIVGLYFLQR